MSNFVQLFILFIFLTLIVPFIGSATWVRKTVNSADIKLIVSKDDFTYFLLGSLIGFLQLFGILITMFQFEMQM